VALRLGVAFVPPVTVTLTCPKAFPVAKRKGNNTATLSKLYIWLMLLRLLPKRFAELI
jgi:hypothetical protein